MEKKWVIAPKISKEFINQFPEFPPVILQLLYNRNLTKLPDIENFLNPDYERDLIDPFLFKDMKKAVHRIKEGIRKKEKIIVHGDYDADGVGGSVILFESLKALGASVDVYLPHREKEGYGINKKTIQEFIKQKVNLIITTDCGISNQEEIELASKHSIDVIITDHHEPPAVLPKAFAIINPRIPFETYPYQYLAGSGVAFKLVCALVIEMKKKDIKKFPIGWEKWLLDLVAISTVTDIVPLTGENRLLVKYGLLVLQKTKRPGLQALLTLIGNNRKIDTFTIGFQIGPRLNAAGRMDHANSAFQLLTAKTTAEAERLAQKLHLNNQARQKVTVDLLSAVKEQIGVFDENKKLVFALGKEWPAGIIGLVAGKIADEYYRPVLIITEQNGKITGSGRSIREFNFIKALEKTQAYFERWGGHSQAGGFTLKQVGMIEQFRIDFTKVVEDDLKELELSPILEIEAEIKLKEINWDLVERLNQFDPFGEANRKPLFVVSQVNIAGWQRLGENGQHLKLLVSQTDSGIKKMIGFSLGERASQLASGDLVDIAFEIGINEWNGNREIELKIIGLKKV